MTQRPRDQLLWSGFRLWPGVQASLTQTNVQRSSEVRLDRWESEWCVYIKCWSVEREETWLYKCDQTICG